MSGQSPTHRNKTYYFNTLNDNGARSPTGIARLHNSPFPSLDPTKQFKSAYERAGFDVYRPGSSDQSRKQKRIVSENMKARSETKLLPESVSNNIMKKRNVSEHLLSSVRNFTKGSSKKNDLWIDAANANKSYDHTQNMQSSNSSKFSMRSTSEQVPSGRTSDQSVFNNNCENTNLDNGSPHLSLPRSLNNAHNFHEDISQIKISESPTYDHDSESSLSINHQFSSKKNIPWEQKTVSRDSTLMSDEESLKSNIISPAPQFASAFQTLDDTSKSQEDIPLSNNSLSQPSLTMSLPGKRTIPEISFEEPSEEENKLLSGFNTIQNNDFHHSIPSMRYSNTSSLYADNFSPKENTSPTTDVSNEYETVKQEKENRESHYNMNQHSEDLSRNLDSDPQNDFDSDIEDDDMAHAFEEVEGQLASLGLKSQNVVDADYEPSKGLPNCSENVMEIGVDSLCDESLRSKSFETAKSRHFSHQELELVSGELDSSDSRQSTHNTSQARRGPSFDFDNPQLLESSQTQPQLDPIEQSSTETKPLNIASKNFISSPESERENKISIVDNKEATRESEANIEAKVENTTKLEKSKPGEGPCRKCGLEIQSKPIYSKSGELSGQWHRRCFTCTLCDLEFSKSISCFVLDDEPYCEYHYHVTNDSLCRVCGLGIVGQCLENDAKERYHIGCLKCVNCEKLVDSDYLSINGSVFCEPCASSLTKLHTASKIEKRRTRIGFI